MKEFIERYSRIISKAENLQSAIQSITSLEEFSSLESRITIDNIFLGTVSEEEGVPSLRADLTYYDKLSSDDLKTFSIDLGKIDSEEINYEEQILKGLWEKS